MKNMPTVTSKVFKEELDEIFKYASKLSKNYLMKCKKGISQYIDTLKYFPYIGRYVYEISNKEYRERIYTNYRIVYQVFKQLNFTYIHFIVHSKMDFLAHYKLYIKRRGKYEKERKSNKHVRKQN